MAYPFHRIEAGKSVVDWISTSPLNAKSFQRSPGWRNVRAATRRTVVEPAEPRILLSADFMPAAADAMADGLDDFQDIVNDFLASSAELDERVPFLLLEDPNYDTETIDPDDAPVEAPTVDLLFTIPVDADGDGFVNNPGTPFDTTDDDETVLAAWDAAGNNDGFVDVAEMLDALLFDPLQVALGNIDGSSETADFVLAVEGDGIFSDGFDVTLSNLGPDYDLEFDLVGITDLTEEPDAEIAFAFEFELTISRPDVVIDLGLEADDLKLLAFTGDSLNPQPVTLPVDSTVSFGLEFGVYTGGQADVDLGQEDFFIRRADDMVFSVTASDNSVFFDLNIGFLGAEVVNGNIDFRADVLGLLIDPDSPEVLGFDTAQYGVEQAGGVVTALNPIPDIDLAHDAGFVLRIGNLGIANDILVAADDNDNTGDLVADVQAAIDAIPGLGDLVTVGVAGGGELQLTLVDSDPTALGFDPESLTLDGILTAAGVPAAFEPGGNISFLLSLGGALPRLVTVRAPGSEQDSMGFAAVETSDPLASLPATNPMNATGTIGGDAQADLTLTVYFNNGSSTAVNVSVTELDVGIGPNTTAAELFQDFNTSLGNALTAAAIPGAVSASNNSGEIILSAANANISAIEVTSADAEALAALGFTVGQNTLLTLTANGAVVDPDFDDGLDNTFDDARFVITVNGSDHTIDIAASPGRDAAGLVADLNTQLGLEGLALNAALNGSDQIVLSATSTSVYSLSVDADNDDLGELLYDLNNALDAAGFNTVSASDDGGSIRLTDSNGDSLEITHTLTFDAGVRGEELDGFQFITAPDAYFESAVGEDSELLLELPVAVKAGLREAGTANDWDPQDMAIVGKFNPLDSSLATFVVDAPDNEDEGTDPQEVLRFFLDYDITPASGDDAPIAVPSPPGDNTLQLVNFAEALQFNQIGPGSFIGMLAELGQALDSIMQNPLFAGYDIPFTDATLRDLTAFEDMIVNSIVYDKGVDNEIDDEGHVDDNDRLLGLTAVGDVIFGGGTVQDPTANAFEIVPTYTTAQEMGARLSEILSLPVFPEGAPLDTGAINPTYDPGTNELTYDMDLISSDRVSVGVNDPENPDDANEIFAAAFEFDVGLTPFGEFLIKPEGVETFDAMGPVLPEGLQVTIEARTTFSATYGFDLTPSLDPDPNDDDNLLEERFFVRDATLGGAFIATLPDVGVEGSALVGIVGVNINDIDGSFGAQFSAQLRAEGGAAGSQVTLEAIQQDIQETSLGPVEGDSGADGFPTSGSDYAGGQLALEIVTDPVVSKLQTLDYDNQDGAVLGNLAEGSKIVTDQNGTAYVLSVDDAGSSGTAFLFGVSGNFTDDDFFYDVRALDNIVLPVPGGQINGGVVTPTFYGELDMAIEVQDGFLGTGYGSEIGELDGVGGNIDLNLAVFGNPNTDTDPAIHSGDLLSSLNTIGTDVGGTFVSLGDYVDVSYFDLIVALEQLGDLVAELEAAYPVLAQTLPVVNKSFSELLGLTEGVDRAVALARSLLENQQELLDVPGEEVPTLTLQSLAGALRDAFGLAPTDGVSLVVDVESVDGTPYLTLDFEIEETISTALGLDVDLGDTLPNLTSAKVLRADGSLGWGFKIGIALDNNTYLEEVIDPVTEEVTGIIEHIDPNDFKLFNPQGGLTGDLSIVGDGAEGIGLVFLAQVGDAAVQVMDALVNIQLEFDLGGLDFSGTDGIKTLADVNFGDFTPNIITQDYDVSVPLFDINGGLTGFLGEIAADGSDLIGNAASLLDSLLDPSALSDLEDVVDNFVADLESLGEFTPLENLLLLTDAADVFFEALQGLLDQATSLPIPLIGNKLAEGARFIEGFRDQFVSQFRELIEFTNDISLDDVTDYINDFFEETLSDTFGSVSVLGELIEGDPGDIFDDEIRWMLSLGDEYSVPFGFGFDVGIPLLSLESDVAIEVGVEWELDIGLGVNQEDGAFIILEDTYGPGSEDDKGELEVRAFIDLPEGTPFRGTLGFLEVEVVNNGSGFEFGIGVDLSNPGASDPTKLAIADIGNLGVDIKIGGGALEGNDAILDLGLLVGITDADFIIPKLATSFVMDWSLDDISTEAVDNVVQQGLDLLEFGAVQVDLSSLMGGLIGDVLAEIERFLGPLLEINDFLNEDIPIISQLFGPTSLLDLANLLGLADTRLFEALETIDQITDTLGDFSGMITLTDAITLFDEASVPNADFASSLFDPDMDFTKAIEDTFGDLGSFLGSTATNLAGTFNDALNNSGVPGETVTNFNNTTNTSIGGADELFKLPWLDDPKILVGLLFGENVSLLEVDLPPLGVGFDYDQFITIFGPLGISIGFGFFVGADLSLGFDTFGFKRFADSGFTNPALVFDGFFLGDRENVTEGADIEELFMELTLTAAAELNLGIATAGVGGGITARLGLDLYDPDNDGAVHISELINSIEAEVRSENGDAFRAIFDLKGAILAELFWYLTINLGIAKLEFGDTIFGPEEIFTFEFPFDRQPILGTEVDTDNNDDYDTLIINAGPNSIDRLNGDVSDGDESFEVEYVQATDTVRIRSTTLGAGWQDFKGGYNHIIFIGGEGDDSITFTGFDESNITFDLQGGAGDDTIEFIENLGATPATGAGAVIYGGTGNDTITGSHLNDRIFGGRGNDTINGGRGYDILIGDSATLREVDADTKTIGALVSNLDGDDTINGGDSDDIIIGGGGLDMLGGDAGNDIILGDGGRFSYDEIDGHIDVSAFDIPDFVPNDRLNPDPAVSTMKQMQNILLALGGIFSGTDLGGGADDTIDGGADNDIIFGGAANDDIKGGTEDDHIVGGRGFDTINGDDMDGDPLNDGDDVLFGNEQDDTINGEGGSDVISGGFGDDTLHGNEGDDYMAGSRGRDVMFGDEDNDEMHGEGEPDIMFGGADDDLVIGGFGADIIMGDDGIVVKFDDSAGVASGDDLIIGNGNHSLADAFEAGADLSIGSLDLILTDVTSDDGNDILSGGEGGDLMFGGGGNDLGGGDVDPRRTTANDDDMSTPNGRDVMIGDGGVVEFNQRRLQRIASVFIGDPAGSYRDTLYGDNGNDIIIGGRGADGDDNGTDPTLNIDDPDLQVAFMLTGGHGPGRGMTDPDVSDADIIIGDNGELVYVGASDTENFGRLAYIQTTDQLNTTGGADTAFGEEDNDIILGGVNGSIDVLSGSTGQDVILGDNGLIHFYYDWEGDGNIEDYASETYTPDDGDPSTIDLIRSFHDGLGGVDIVSGQEDSDVLIGGNAGDFIYGDDATASSGSSDLGDIMLGDNGDLFLEGASGKRLVQGVAVDLITTTDVVETTGGADTMSGNAGGDVIIGGVNDGGTDKLYGDAFNPVPALDGDDIMLGDNGLLDYTWDAAPGGPDTDRNTLDLIETTARANGNVRGGVDFIFGNAGGDTAFGGTGADRIFGDNDESSDGSGVADTFGTDGGDDFLFGDQGRVELVNNLVTFITSTDVDSTEGGADHIQGNAGGDFIIGGVAGDELHGEAFLVNALGVADLVMNEQGDDTILGDQGDMRFDATGDLVPITGTYTAQGDGDPLTLDLVQTFATGNLDLGGSDEIYGNGGSDVAMGGADGDLIHGDFYKGSLVRALNPGDDDLLGDGGQKFFQDGHVIMLRTIEYGLGGVDIIHGNDGDDTVVGGAFGDLLYGETDLANLALAAGRAGQDVMLGDNARLDWTLPDDDILGRQDIEDAYGGTTVTVDPFYDGAGWLTLDRITTIVPTDGGNDVMYGNGNGSVGAGDVMFGGTGNDNMYGDSGDANPDGVDGVDGSDTMFGDHGKLYPSIEAFDGANGDVFTNNNFFSIDTAETDGADNSGDGDHNDFHDIMFGNAAADIMIGGQDDDIMFGGTGDDDMIGGHNVAGGEDELDDMSAADILAISPIELSDLDPTDVEDINDIMDGGADDDVMAGDNAIIVRQSDDLSPRFRVTEADGLLYALESDLVDNLANVDVGFTANVTGDRQAHQDMTLVRTVTLLDHSEAIETAAAAEDTDPRVFGNDVMAGGSEDDEMFGQLGDDVMQGDGSITLNGQIPEINFDPFDPAQDADPSFDVRNFTQRVDLDNLNDLDWTINFDIDEDLADGDDYMEGNGGNDRMYGNLGQDDMIGGSSSLFGLGDAFAAFQGVGSGVLLRPDGADMMYGGAGNPDLLGRNASFGGPDNDITGDTIVPAGERHATDADTMLGDNGDIFRIVVDADGNPLNGVQAAYAVFNYDRDATTADGFVDDGYGIFDEGLTIRVRAVNLGDYGYSYVDDGDGRESLQFLPTARGEGDLMFGESGDDQIHGMTGDDVIFGGSEHDDLYGEIGNDFLLGGTGVDGILGDDGIIQTRRNSDSFGEALYGINPFDQEQTNLKKNESADPNSLNALIFTPGTIQRAIINVESELVKSVELFAFRTDDIEGQGIGEFGASIRFNDLMFGGLDDDFMHGGDGDDGISGAEALPVYYSGEGFQVGPNQEFAAVNAFLQDMQDSPPNNVPELTDNPFWFDFAPYNPGDLMRFEGKPILEENGQRARTRDEFAWYDEFNPRRKIMFDFDAAGDIAPLATLDGVANPIDFILNFNEEEGADDTRFSDAVKASDGDDRIFGDLGNDWQVGGTGRDHMYGGRGNDLLNMDDNHDSGPGGRVGPHDPTPDPLDNTQSDEFQAYADIVYSGAGRDVMILNTGADRAIDWVGEFNSYIVPFSPFGAFHISRGMQPQIPEFLYALSGSDGVDNRADTTQMQTNALDGQLYVDQKTADVRTDDPDPERAYEPYGELGMVRQTDFDWQEQTGAPNDPQPGNLQGKREIMRRELFNDLEAEVALAADVGLLSLTTAGTLQATPENLGEEVVGLYPLDTLQPQYTEILVTVNAAKDKQGWKSNGYVIFDYQGPEDFKFAGIEAGTDKLQIGHRDASGWVVDTQIPIQLRADTDYDLTVVLFGSQATVYVDQNKNVSYDFGEPLNDGGMVGLATNNSITEFDDLQIQTLPPNWTFTQTSAFDSDADNPFSAVSGSWTVSGGSLQGDGGVSVDSLYVAPYSRLEMQADISSDGQGGFVFDYFGSDEYKYVTLNSVTGEVEIGHYVDGQYYVDAFVDAGIKTNKNYTVTLTMFGSTATVAVDGASVLTHEFNSILNDGLFGVIDVSGGTSFDNFLVRGDDPSYITGSAEELAAASGSWSLDSDALSGNGGVALADDDLSGYDTALIEADVTAGGQGGLVFDYAGSDDYKFVTLDANTGNLIIGHYDGANFVVDAAIAVGVQAGTSYNLSIVLEDDGVSVSLDGQSAGSYSYGDSVMDGLYGALDVSGGTTLDNFLARGASGSGSLPLMVAGGAASTDAETLDSALIEHVADRAIELLDQHPGVNGGKLAAVPVAVADLPGDRLAVWQGDRIVLDHNAAGHGWFAGVGGAEERIDLLSVLMHEYGHAMGLGHNAGVDFMADELGVGQRFAAKEQATARVFDEDSGDFLATDAGVDDELLVVESADAPVDGLVSW